MVMLKFKKSNLYCASGITLKRGTSAGAYHRGLALGQHSTKETSQRWRTVGVIVSDSTGPGIKPQSSRTASKVLDN